MIVLYLKLFGMGCSYGKVGLCDKTALSISLEILYSISLYIR